MTIRTLNYSYHKPEVLTMLAFLVVALIVAVALYFIPQILPMDAQVWLIIRLVVIVALLVYGYTALTGRRLW